MQKTLIGSKALLHWYPDLGREPSDTDYAVSEEVIIKTIGVEYLYNPIFKQFNNSIATPEQLLALKVSHLFWETNWDKHMFDVQFLLGKGIKLNLELYRQFREFFEGYLPKVRRSALNQSKEEFFTNAVNEDVDEHDKLHLLLADVPAYTKILKEGCEVEVDFDKFENLSFEEKLDVVIEEAQIMAHERYSSKLPWYKAYGIQLKQNIMKHYPEPIALFAIHNYKQLLNLRELKIEEKFKKLQYGSKTNSTTNIKNH